MEYMRLGYKFIRVKNASIRIKNSRSNFNKIIPKLIINNKNENNKRL